jgi:hypothetical protein
MACPTYWKMYNIYISVVDIHFYQACPYAGLVCMLHIFIGDSLSLLAKLFINYTKLFHCNYVVMTFLKIHKTWGSHGSIRIVAFWDVTLHNMVKNYHIKCHHILDHNILYYVMITCMISSILKTAFPKVAYKIQICTWFS